MRLAFMGSPDFAVPALKRLIASDHDVVAVYSQPVRARGRGKKPRPTPVQAVAEAAGIPVLTPASMRDPDAVAAFKALDLDAAVVVAYGQILPPAVLEAPKYGCINIHASLLPRWRGAAPIHRAIMAGDAETGVGIMAMEAGLDTGPVYREARTAMTATDTVQSLSDRLSDMGAEALMTVLDDLVAGRGVAMPQAEDGVTYARKIDKAEAAIDWSQSAGAIDRQVRGLCPFPGAYAVLGPERLKVLEGFVVKEMQADAPAGEVVAIGDRVAVACGDGGVYAITRAQRAGKGAMAVAEMLRGFGLSVGDQFVAPAENGA